MIYNRLLTTYNEVEKHDPIQHKIVKDTEAIQKNIKCNVSNMEISKEKVIFGDITQSRIIIRTVNDINTNFTYFKLNNDNNQYVIINVNKLSHDRYSYIATKQG